MPKSFHVGIKAVITSGDQLLLLSRMDAEGKLYWDCPGGRIDGNESIDQTLKRELKEEILNLPNHKPGPVLGAYRLPKDIEKAHSLVVIFYRITIAMFIPNLSKEHQGFAWFDAKGLSGLSQNSSPYINQGYLEMAKTALSK